MKKVDICLSPLNYAIIDPKNTIAVVVDIIRASASICTALEYGAECIIPLTSIEEALSMKDENTLTSGERDSFKVESCDLGNSPSEYQDPQICGKRIAFTSTNGTVAIECAAKSRAVVVGSFLNFDALLAWLLERPENVVVVCSGWKLAVSLEDVVFAGKLADELMNRGYVSSSYAVELGLMAYSAAKDDLFHYTIENSPRLKAKLHLLEKDIRHCFQHNTLTAIPLLVDGKLIKAL